MTNENRRTLEPAVSTMIDQLVNSILNESLDSIDRVSKGAQASGNSQMTAEENAPSELESSRSLADLAEATTSPKNAFSNSSILDGLLISPIIRGLLSLFSGNNETPIEALTKFSFPQELVSRFSATTNAEGLPIQTSFDSFGISRGRVQNEPSINLTIQAMDSKSIIDRSDDIAFALRRALLSNSSIQDNIGEI